MNRITKLLFLCLVFLTISLPLVSLSLVPLDIDLEYPWGMTWIDSKSMLVTQKNGKIYLVDTELEKQVEIEHNIPSVKAGQGGLLDIISEGNRIWVSCSIEKNGSYTTAVYKAVWDNTMLRDLELIYEVKPYLRSTIHFGSRLEIMGDYLYISIGERGGGVLAQDAGNAVGSIVRIHKDGTIPDNNTSHRDWIPELYQMGVRNPQGMDMDPISGNVYISNHGPKGGDFIGPVLEGTNYGWNEIAWGGTGYSDEKIGNGNSWEPGFLKPDYIWVPSIGIGGIKFYRGDAFSQWNNNLLIASLKFKYLSVLFRDGDRFVKEEIILKDSIGRIRDIEINQAGEIFLIADEMNTRLYKLTP